MPLPNTAFHTALHLPLSPPHHSLKCRLSRPLRRASQPRTLQMQTPPDSPPPTSDTDSPPPSTPQPTTSAAEILRTLREEAARDTTPETRSMLGVYRDVDGKSNVWAVEPLEETDTRPQLSKATLIAAAAAFIVVALLVLPLLPFTNPDQL